MCERYNLKTPIEMDLIIPSIANVSLKIDGRQATMFMITHAL